MKRTQPPAGWSVELLGLIQSVQFDNGAHRLLWSDGRWFTERRTTDGRWMSAPAPGVPSAASMAEARNVGCAYLQAFESEAA